MCFHRFSDGGYMTGSIAAASSGDIQKAGLRKFSHIGSHVCGTKVESSGGKRVR